MKTKKQYKTVFRTQIDVRSNEEPFQSLRPGQTYYFESQREVSYRDIVNGVVRIITTELKSDLQKYTDIFVKEVEAQAVYEGSIEIIYTVILSFLNLVSGLKDLFTLKSYIERDEANEYNFK